MLATLICGPMLPLLIDFLPSFFAESINDDIVYSSLMLQAAEVKTASVQSIENIRFSYKQIFLFVYILGILTSLALFLYGIFRIIKIRRGGQISSNARLNICLHEEDMAPFTFFNTVYLPKESNWLGNNSVFEHEVAHIKGIHSIDVILARVISIFFWCAIPVHFFHRLLTEVHEYIADKKVLDNHSYGDYITELIHTIVPEKSVRISQSSISGNLNKRLKMMKKQKSTRWLRLAYLLSIPLIYFTLTGLTLSENFNSETSKNDLIFDVSPIIMVDTIPDLFLVVEEMPRFPGCEDLEEITAKENCSKEKLLEYLSQNIKYPAEAKINGTEGMVVIQFVIEPDGTVANIVALREVGDGCTEEAIRVIKQMNVDGKRWTPGYQKGKSVRTQFTLPVKFRLDSKKEKQGAISQNVAPPVNINPDFPPPPPPPPQSLDEKPVFMIVEDMPYLAVCKDEKDKDARKKCNEIAMIEKISTNLNYPTVARENGVQGKVIISFIVNEDGTASDHKILRDIGANCGKAALDAVKLLQDWIPGKQRGKEVRVQYTMPVMFKLNNEKKDTE